MLALAAYEANVHTACGTYLPDATADDGDGAWVADMPVRCHVCTARAVAVAAHVTGPHAPHPEALLWPVTRRGR